MEGKFREKEIPKAKLKLVEEIVEKMKNSKAIMLVSIKNLPAKQLQIINKKLKGKAEIKIAKKTIIKIAIDKIEKGGIKNLKEHLGENQALVFSQLGPFELSLLLSREKSKARAKVGQVVDEDVVIEPGPTELVPGPVVSELGGLGIKFSIEDGKINIQERKAILKAGQEVDEKADSLMAKLDIKPISVGLKPIVAYDSEEDKVYENIEINQDKVIEELKDAASRALAFAVKIVYVCKETLSYILGKAKTEEETLSRIIKEKAGQNNKESEAQKTQEIKEENQEKEGEVKEKEEGKKKAEENEKDLKKEDND